jgi:hypothetical protein
VRRRESVTIVGATGETSEAQLEEDGFHMLWLVNRNRRNSGRVQILLSAALQNGWRIVRRARVRAREGAVMNDAAWWARVVQARTERDDLRPTRVWVLRKEGREAAIDVKAVPGIGAEIVLSVDGQWRKDEAVPIARAGGTSRRDCGHADGV